MIPRVWAIAIAVGAVALNLLIIGPKVLGQARAGAGDFSQFYVGGKLAFTGDLYNVDRVIAVQHAVLDGEQPSVMPVRLPFYYALMAPFRWLPFPTAHLLWTLLMIGAVGGFLAIQPMSGDRRILWIVCGASLPLVGSIVVGQDVAVLLLVCAISLRLREKGWEVAAGVVASLLIIKFHFFLPIPILLLLRREFRMLKGLIAGSALLGAVSFLVAGPGWPVAYVRMLTNPVINPALKKMPNLWVLTSLIPQGALIAAFIGVLVAAAAVTLARRARFELAWAGALVAGVLLSSHAYPHDCALLIPALVYICQFATRNVARALAFVALSPLPYAPVEFNLGVVPAMLFTVMMLALWTRKPAIAAPAHEPTLHAASLP